MTNQQAKYFRSLSPLIVGPRAYKIFVRDPIPLGGCVTENTIGLCNYLSEEISVRKDLKVSLAAACLWHEIAHAIWNDRGAPMTDSLKADEDLSERPTETIAEVVGVGLHELFAHNPQLIPFLEWVQTQKEKRICQNQSPPS